MKNIHVLPTDKPSRLIFNSFHKSFCYQKEIDGMYINDGKVIGADFWGLQKALNNGFKAQNIYTTSDEEIKDCYVINTKTNNIYFENWYSPTPFIKKIILTTDKDLIADGVQSIPDEFLEWFVKNPSCEKVELKQLFKDDFGFWVSYLDLLQNEPLREVESKYKIIIPKEETKQETLEELKKWKQEALIAHEINQKVIEKLMAEKKLMYSEEDMTKFVSFVGKNYIKAKGFYYMKGDFEKKHKVSIPQILEQFKNK
jgi:hypothetical protein